MSSPESASHPRLLYLVHNYGKLAGVELHTKALVTGLCDRYAISIVYPQEGKLRLLQGVDRVTTYAADPPSWPVTPYRAPRTEQALAKVLGLVQPDLIHIQHFIHWPLSVIDQAVGSGAKVVLSFHDFYAITPQFTMLGARDPEETFSPAFCRTVFGSDISASLQERRQLLSESLRKVHQRVTISPFLQRLLAQIFPYDYRVIEYGIKPFAPRSAPASRSKVRFGFVGVLIPQKGWQTVFEAFPAVHQRFPAAELHLYGGPLPSIPGQAGVTFHGTYEPEDLPRICAEIDVAVIPSVFAETYCLVLSEMWMAGLPVAVADIGALGERVVDGVNGKKFAPGDVRGIAQTLCWFLEQDSWREWQIPRPKTLDRMLADYDLLYRETLAAKDDGHSPRSALRDDSFRFSLSVPEASQPTQPRTHSMAAPSSPAAPAAAEPWLEVTSSRHFASWLAAERISLAFTTYQTGKLFLLGRHPDGQLAVFERTFNRSMGLWADGQTLWLSSLYQLWRFENMLRPGELYQGYDRLYVPKIGYTTGDLDIHDLAVEASGRLLFVNTKFGCLATMSERYSFTPLWRPAFLSKLAAEDRCHLNGLALEGGQPRYVTVVSTSDVTDGWRDRRRDGGCVLEVPSSRTVLAGLSMPHSPRVYRERLWLANSGAGYFGSIDLAAGKFEPLTFCPGYLRGLAFTGDYAVVGLSRPRHDKTFSGLALDEELAKRGAEARCGLQVIDLRSGDVAHWVRLEGMVSELYDVVVLPGVVRPMALGFKTDEIQRTIAVGDAATL
jgi:uncharacterized protein (TIGR03032 family)